MQSPLFGYTEVQDTPPFALQNETMLRVEVNGGRDVLARTGSMVAYQGQLEFDAEYRPRGRRRNSEHLNLMRCSGNGTVFFANLAQVVHVLDVPREGLTVDSGYVLAMDSSLAWDVISVDSQYGIAGTGKYNLLITGRGQLALMTSGRPLLMQVTPERYVSVDSDAVVAWSTDLTVQMQAQTSSSSVWRRRGNTGEGWELNFMGHGFALVQPSELLPPQNAQIGGGLRGQFGMDRQNSGNIFTN